MARSPTPSRRRRSTRSKKLKKSHTLVAIESDPSLLRHVIIIQSIIRKRIAQRKVEKLRRTHDLSRNYIGQVQDESGNSDGGGMDTLTCCPFSCSFSNHDDDHDETGLSNDDTIDKVFRKKCPQWFMDLFFIIVWILFVLFFLNLFLLLWAATYRAQNDYCDVVPLFGNWTFDLNEPGWRYHGLVSFLALDDFVSM